MLAAILKVGCAYCGTIALLGVSDQDPEGENKQATGGKGAGKAWDIEEEEEGGQRNPARTPRTER